METPVTRQPLHLFLTVYLILLIPVFLPGTPPLTDYPNHLARMTVAFEPTAQLETFYDFQWRNMTNLGLELVTAVLGRAVPVSVAMELYLALTLAALLGGAAALHASLYRRLSVSALLAGFFLWGGALQFGFLSFSLGIGLALLALALWIALERQPVLLRLAVAAPCTIVLFYTHILALGVYGLLVAGVELSRLWRPDPDDPDPRGRLVRLLLTGGQFVPVLAVMWLAGRHGDGAGEVTLHYFDNLPVFKLAMLQRLLSGDAPALGAVMLMVTLAVMGLAWRRCGRPVAARILPGLLALVAAYLLLPQGITTGETPNWALDWRFLTPAALVAVAALPDPFRTARERQLAAMLIVGLLALKTALMAAGPWRVAATDEAALTACLDRALPRGGAVASLALPVPGEGMGWLDRTPSPRHMAAYAVPWREAFVPSLFAFANQQPLRYAEAWAAPAAAAGQIEIYNPRRIDWTAYEGMDILLLLRPSPDVDVLAPFGGALPISAQDVCSGQRYVAFALR